MNHTIRSIIAFCFTAHFAQAELYLLTGSPTPSYGLDTFGAGLFRIADDGKVTEIAELFPESVGSTWVGASYEWRKIVIRSESVIVLDFDKGGISKMCKNPLADDALYYWLANQPALGPTLEWLSVDSANRYSVHGMIVDASVPCEKSFVDLAREDMKHFMAHGHPALGDIANSDAPRGASMHSLTRQIGVVGETEKIPLGLQVPEALRSGIQDDRAQVLINNPKTLVLSLETRTGDIYRTLVFRKNDKTWHILPARGDRPPRLRAFGKYITAIEIRGRSTQNPKSGGEQNWKHEDGRMGPPPGGRIDASHVYPGRLHVYDVETERIFSITTNEGDSEILLIEDGNVYYRANDQLYSAPIGEEGIGKARLVATDEIIRYVHWAFIKH